MRALVAATIAASALTTAGAAASDCGDQPRNGHDPFGSCEDADGRLHCGSNGAVSQELPAGSRVTVGEHGAQWCLDRDNRDAEPYGRATVYNSDGHVGLAVDGDDDNAPGPIPMVPLHGWGRVDVETDRRRACASTDVVGTYWPEGGPQGGIACTP